METLPWSKWRLVSFRFLCIYFMLSTAIWGWFWSIPVLTYIPQGIEFVLDKVVNLMNTYLLHVKRELIPMGGSGDTSYGWAQLYSIVILAAAGCLVWSLIDRKRIQYELLAYGLKVLLRYNLVVVSFSYGVIKVFGLQMTFPNVSQLATRLGDFLPMRLSWMFIGYSYPYQFFSGVMELLVGILLLNRRTITFGALLGMGVYSHVFLLNMAFDIPVKIYSFQLLVCCLFLVFSDRERILNFLVLNKPTDRNMAYDFVFTKKWQKITRLVLKIGFILVFVLLPFYQVHQRSKMYVTTKSSSPSIPDWYEVTDFIVNRDTLAWKDTSHWKDLIFDNTRMGSIGGHQQSFRKVYGREYFGFSLDTLKKEMKFVKGFRDTTSIFLLRYEIPDTNQLVLSGIAEKDTLLIRLKRKNYHFQLTEKQFHWLSEYNR